MRLRRSRTRRGRSTFGSYLHDIGANKQAVGDMKGTQELRPRSLAKGIRCVPKFLAVELLNDSN